jgi:outer membrane protein assembly factor BamB
MDESSELRPLGMVEGDLLIASDLDELTTLSIEDGRKLWTRSLPDTSTAIMFDEGTEQIYVAKLGGSLEAFRLSDLQTANAESIVDPVWTASVGSSASVVLIPLPQRGVVASTGSQISAFSDSGELLWRGEPMTGIRDWTHSEEALILLGREGVLVANDAGAERSTVSIMGHRIVASGLPLIYAEDGIYRFDLDTRSVEPFFALPSGFPRSGAISELPGGGVLAAHTDLDDRRLIAIDAEGGTLWEFSLANLGVRAVEFLAIDDQVYLLAQFPIGNSTGIDLFQVDTGNGALTRIFSGGTRAPGSLPLTISVAGDLLLISIEDVGLTAFEPHLALDGE